jgi:hypothetical protein
MADSDCETGIDVDDDFDVDVDVVADADVDVFFLLGGNAVVRQETTRSKY